LANRLIDDPRSDQRSRKDCTAYPSDHREYHEWLQPLPLARSLLNHLGFAATSAATRAPGHLSC
jgi:hypothetical protein